MYQLDIAFLSNIPISNTKKLVPNLFDEEKYVIHYENLQLYLRLVLKLKKIDRVLEFSQSQWLKEYIKLNTQKRMEAKNKKKTKKKTLTKMEKCCTN